MTDRYIVIVDENGTWKIDSQHAEQTDAVDRLDMLCPEIDGEVSNTETVRLLDTSDSL